MGKTRFCIEYLPMISTTLCVWIVIAMWNALVFLSTIWLCFCTLAILATIDIAFVKNVKQKCDSQNHFKDLAMNVAFCKKL